MADDRPQQNHPEDKHHQSSSRYLADDHQQGRSPAMAATVTLPSIHEARAPAGYGSQSQPPPPSAAPGAGGYPHDARYASPSAVNGYPPPTASGQPPSTYLPPLQTSPSDSRSPAYPPPDQRGAYYDDRRPYPEHHQPQQYAAADGYYYRGPPSGPLPLNGYPCPPQGAYQEFAQPAGSAAAMAQAAPRQRTSIACRYCRKRKIRCSGYQNTPGGKCQNCARMNQECIFQPVSSSTSTAFIPVSAVPGGVPPGTQLFGAYGQPLAPSPIAVAHPYEPQHHGPPGGPPPNFYPPPQQQQPTESPTESFSSYGDEASQVAGRRRRRTPEEEPRRRSPAEFSNTSSPGGLAHLPYQPPRQSPRNAPALPQLSGQDGRSPRAQNGSSGGSSPARQPAPPTSQPHNHSVMSLSNLVKNDIDRTMINRLNHSRDTKGANGAR